MAAVDISDLAKPYPRRNDARFPKPITVYLLLVPGALQRRLAPPARMIWLPG